MYTITLTNLISDRKFIEIVADDYTTEKSGDILVLTIERKILTEKYYFNPATMFLEIIKEK